MPGVSVHETRRSSLPFFACCFARERVEVGWDAGEVVPNLWLGSAAALESHADLKANGITTVITVRGRARRRAPPHVIHVDVQLDDRADADLLSSLPTSLDAIDEALDVRRRTGAVLVHCACGVSRSVAICAAWLIVRMRLSLSEAMRMVRIARPIARPNPGFIVALQHLEAAGGDVRCAAAGLSARKAARGDYVH